MIWAIYGFPKTEQNLEQSQALLQSLDLRGRSSKIKRDFENKIASSEMSSS